MSDPTSRTLALLALLQTHRHWSGTELATRLGVSERTVRRDVDRLRDLGYPVNASPGVDGGYQLAAGAHLPPLVVDDDEAVALAVGLHTAAGAAVEGIDETTVRVLAKLEQILPDHLRRRVDAVTKNVEVLRWAPKTAIPAATLSVLATACRDNEEARFEYTRRDGESSGRLVQPHQLVSAGHRWYLVAWDVRRSDWRTFRVDRMTDPRLAGARFAPRDLPADSAAAFVAASIRSATSNYEAVVVVDGEPERIDAMRRWFGGQAEPINGTPNRILLGADALEWLASMITILSVSFDLTVESAPDEVFELLGGARNRLAAARKPS